MPDGLAFIDTHMLNKDGADHRRLRKLVTKAFTPRMVEQLRPRIQEIADELIDAVESRGEMDLVDEFAFPLPITVIAELLGIPVADRDRFRRWTNAIMTPPLTPEDMAQFGAAVDEFVAYLRELFERRRSTPGDDLVSALLQVEEGGDTLSEEELFSMVVLLIIAGHETTVSLIGNAVLALLQHPDQRSVARARPRPNVTCDRGAPPLRRPDRADAQPVGGHGRRVGRTDDSQRRGSDRDSRLRQSRSVPFSRP